MQGRPHDVIHAEVTLEGTDKKERENIVLSKYLVAQFDSENDDYRIFSHLI